MLLIYRSFKRNAEATILKMTKTKANPTLGLLFFMLVWVGGNGQVIIEKLKFAHAFKMQLSHHYM